MRGWTRPDQGAIGEGNARGTDLAGLRLQLLRRSQFPHRSGSSGSPARNTGSPHRDYGTMGERSLSSLHSKEGMDARITAKDKTELAGQIAVVCQ